MLASGALSADPHQEQLVQQLSQLLEQLQGYSSAVGSYKSARQAYEVCVRVSLTRALSACM
jgi:hypothetical protein